MADYNLERKHETEKRYSGIRERARKYGEAMDRAHYHRMERAFARGGHGKDKPVGEQIGDYERFESDTAQFERGKKPKRLEQRLGFIITFLVIGIALMLGSLTLTGNAVSNLTGTTPGLLGLILFVAGILGIIFYLRRK